MAKLYNEPKVLYFASRDEGLHVDSNEQHDTDLSKLVSSLKRDGLIEKAASDDSGSYYRTTKSGLMAHLRHQINYRKRNNKDYSKQESELRDLEATAK